jgi:aminocarboxymuconate-semialdehyde decarboxylase
LGQRDNDRYHKLNLKGKFIAELFISLFTFSFLSLLSPAGESKAAKMVTKSTIVDIHTHVYPPSYISLLKSRSSIPYIRSFPPSSSLRLVILPAEDTESTSRGRPVGAEYYDINEKIKFMDTHSIDISVISLANPWLDWVPKEEAVEAARNINDEVNEVCGRFPGRLFAFATLPLSGGKKVIVQEIRRLKGLKFMRGIILGTTGLGKGLDDPDLLPIFEALQEAKLPIFLHPHYGLPSSVWGERANDYGHVLPLALGFPLETTIAVTRMILAGLFEKVPELEMILAHSGGTLPFLAGRIESCIEHDAHLKAEGKLGKGRKTVWEILKKNIYLDAVIYGDVGLKAAIQASGEDRIMFGTDHPFFPPLEEELGKWASVETNYEGVRAALGDGAKGAEAVLGGNAVRVLNLSI